MIRFLNPKRKNIAVVVVGNCQARPVAQFLTSASSEITVTATGVVHLLKNEEKDYYEDHFRKADLIFAQRVADNYPCSFVRTDVLRDKWGAKVIVWPNIFYRGYNPELIYVRLANRLPLRGPLGDYHIQTFLYGWKKGLTVKDTLKLHYDIEYNRKVYSEVPKISLAELKKREADCDIKISNHIEERLRHNRLFFTFNHPKNELLLHTVNTLLEYANIRHDESKNEDVCELLGQFELPVNPWIAGKYDFEHIEAKAWKGVEVKNIDQHVVTTGKKCEFQDEKITEVFFKIYDANRENVIDFENNQVVRNRTHPLEKKMIGQLTESEFNTLIRLSKKALWSSPETRSKIQANGVNIIPANFYSNIPLIEEIRSSFEYRNGKEEIYNSGLFVKKKIKDFIELLSTYTKEFSPPIEGDIKNPGSFFWNNPAFSYSDAMAYYCLLRHFKPDHVLEIGSGFSTLVANQALTENGRGKLTLIEPYPKDLYAFTGHPRLNYIQERLGLELRK